MKKLLLLLLLSSVACPTKHHTKVQVVVDKDSPSSSKDLEAQASEEKHAHGESKRASHPIDPELVADKMELKKDWTKFKIAVVTAGISLVGAGAGAMVTYLSKKC